MTGSTKVTADDAQNGNGKKRDDKKQKNEGTQSGVLGWIEKVGNKLPEPFWLFVILGIITVASSWIGNRIGMQATNPGNGETVQVENLLTGEYISKMVTDAVQNFIAFPPLGVILTVMLGVAVAEHSGLLSAMIRAMVAKVSPRMLTFMVALAGVTGSIASDAIFVIIVPLGAMAFHAVGRSPLVGTMVGFAAAAGGFNASLILNITDLLLAGISTTGANIIDPNYEVSPLANIFFVIPSAIVLAILITVLTELFTEKRMEHMHEDEDIVDEELDLDKAGEDSDEDNDKADNDSTSDQDLTLTDIESKGLKWSGIALLAFFVAYFALLFIPGSPFARPEEGFMESPLIRSIAVPIALMFFVVGIVYGLVTKSITGWSDVPEFMTKGITTLVPILVLFFAVAQFLAWFQWSNLGSWTAIKGAELLQRWDLPTVVLFFGFVIMVAFVNLFITSGSAQWALMAPILVPMMMLVGVSPEVSQMLFRIGDSASSIITPMSPYFALTLTFMQKYYKKAGVGTLISMALPYFFTILIGWFAFFLIWYYLGIPLGPGAPMTYEV
ncbi:p-aminobenzoyl-glutamate transport protein [Corynebacterium glaucum]|uniref:p-aminobenzoyl-glutamate transport protein n=1 Tax=Corynebacterium glaucum TaxID=187491 RepID=A0A1Q2HY52_9CORY|nr:AbgT family transporter [Corynebacterium glaucum]AQQ15764.1 p-aminobenzoyl-glutamate transport protein [Corynebacterium glaucum]